MIPLVAMLGLAVALTALIFVIVAVTYAMLRLWEWLSPSREASRSPELARGFEVIVNPKQPW